MTPRDGAAVALGRAVADGTAERETMTVWVPAVLLLEHTTMTVYVPGPMFDQAAD
jgi:hypothetical protein